MTQYYFSILDADTLTHAPSIYARLFKTQVYKEEPKLSIGQFAVNNYYMNNNLDLDLLI